MSKKIKTVLIVTGAVLLLAVIGLATALGVVEKKRKESDEKIAGIYEKSYYETVDSMNDVELKLSKISVIEGGELKRELLMDVWRECDVSATNFSQLGTESEEISKVIKFLNQLGDYCLFLSTKMKTTPLNDEEKANINKFYDVVKELNVTLNEAKDSLTDGKTVAIITSEAVSGAIKNHSSVEYPEMIYDGPFSDGLNDRQAKFLAGKAEITTEEGVSKVSEYFKGATDIKYIGEGTASIPTYLYEFKLGRNVGNAQITKTGGYLAMYNAYCEINEPNLSEEECVAKADEYMTNFGFSDMKAVWVSNDDSTVYINYAYCKDDVIFYPDLIKVKICAETGDIIGLESQNYLYNHTEREVSFPSKTIVINSLLTVKQQSKCVIPTEWNAEINAIEVIAEKDGTEYYIYLNPETGEEIKVLVTIEESGKLLM